ncbi:ATP-binding protein [Haloterrigena sp. H1]|uniref:ATP-binding protein n=1 Tax=Haloterrigena sp. H1 TaxID=2552943 RepID=UPI00110DF99B|nr:ATP-binding protein [Haloterrigena sp. H1]TMT85339.1 ATP-binding protein [Haloterrigena sp. H1]
MRDTATSEHLLAELDRIHSILERYLENRSDTTSGTTVAGANGRDERRGTADPTALAYSIPSVDQSGFGTLADDTGHTQREALENGKRRLETLVDGFDLDDLHRELLLIALLPDVDPTTEDLFARATNDRTKPRPTVGLVADLFSRTNAEFVTATALVGEQSPLRTNDLILVDDVTDSRSKLERELRVDDRIYEYLLGHDGVDPRLEATIDDHSPIELEESLTNAPADATLEDLLLDDSLRTDLASLPDDERGTGRRVYFYGPPGSGVDCAVEACCQDDRYLRADLRAVLAADALEALVREATILDVPVHLRNADATVADRETDHSLEGVLARFREFDNDLFVTGERAWVPTESRRASVDAIYEFGRPSIARRRQFWEARTDELPDDLEPETMASTFDLTQGQLEAALATADARAGGDDRTLADVRAGCRAQSSDALDELAQHVEPTKTWADIEVDDRTERQLRTLETHITNRGLLYDDWGFRDQTGNAGIVSLFRGYPGTGKTLAAEVLANAVGMDIYKIDLSSMVSKYIGETEENLEQLFQAAEQSNAILLFDEADAIFGDRADVADATDRYANVEVNYLLQRVETYDGVIFLTTNYAQNIDTAFTRRITHSIRFDEPDADTREEIWKGVFPDGCPLEEIDWKWLAGFDYSGGTIEKLATHIAIYVTSLGDETITMRHVVEALERYKRDRNSRIREQDFEPYLEFLQGPTEREAKERRHQERRAG